VVEVSGSCARKADGTLWCWGRNEFGQVGDGTTQSRLSAVQVATLGAGVAQVAASRNHVCARKTDGTLWCWGAHGTVGDGSFQDRLLPVQVPALGADVAQIWAGSHLTYALKMDGTLWCWGSGSFGDGVLDRFRSGPVQVTTLGAGVTEISGGGGAVNCARKMDSTLWCWGANGWGEVGDGTTENRATPVQVTTLGAAVSQVSASNKGMTCARKTDGTAW
jgi:alpha-tubulin suppressor-like RCC1 family protein